MTTSKADARKKARDRMRQRRKRTDYEYDRARNRAVARLIELHRRHFEKLLAEERGQQ